VGDVTGVLVERGTPDELAEAMREVDWERFSPEAARANAERFSPASFRERFRAEVMTAVSVLPSGP
jgi:hypothetical protein